MPCVQNLMKIDLTKSWTENNKKLRVHTYTNAYHQDTSLPSSSTESLQISWRSSQKQLLGHPFNCVYPKKGCIKRVGGGSFCCNNTTQLNKERTTLRVYGTLRGKRKCIGWYSNNAYCTWHNATDEQGWMAKLIHSFALQKRWIKGLKYTSL